MKIAIAGYGAEGEANYRYWNTSDNQVVIVDAVQPKRPLPLDSSSIIGDDAFGKLTGFDMVVRTAGLAPHKIITDGKVWSATNEFFTKCPAPIIGVTGSKGKGTTSSLIASILRASGKTVHLVGNIGVPALEVLGSVTENDVVVYELSSFQLWDITASPQVAVVLYIEPDHLDVHADMNEYVQAKANITRYQSITDRVIYNEANEWARLIAELSPGQRIPYPSERGVHVMGDQFFYGETPICMVDNLLLPGRHNLDNACAAISAVWSWVQDGAVIAEGLRSFDGLPHRLKFVRELSDVSYYDDSIATTPGSAIAALGAFATPKVMVLGGSSKGADFSLLAEEVVRGNVRHVVLIGEEAPRLRDALEAAGFSAITQLPKDGTTMMDIVTSARAAAQPGDTVIMTPACASFDMFSSYVDRGEQYVNAVMALQLA